MNILIPHTWLLEHLETNASPLEIQKLVSLCGPSIERIYDRDGESVYDIEVTTNRVDSMSVRGIAREVAVILNQFGIEAKLKPLKLPSLESLQPASKSANLPLPKITIETPNCHRVLGLVLSHIVRHPTPKYMADRLLQTDQNIHDAAIDITNYVTHELGHPCHAFDYDRIMELGGEIIIKEAAPGKKFTTLDGAEFTTVGGEIVFENISGQIIDLPSIKGALNTSVNAKTKNILFWIESLDPKKVRVASMTHAIRTVAAQLCEKQVDPHLADSVIAKGVQLFQELCDAKIASPVYDAFQTPRHPKAIKTPLKTISNYLGLTLPTSEIMAILTKLECEVGESSDHLSLSVTPPTFRHDLEIPADVVEEVARIYGYQNLPSQLMATAIPTLKPTDVNFDLEFKIKHNLADKGWQELYTYSLVSENLATESGHPASEHLKIANPLTDDKVYLRRSLLPSLLATAKEMLASTTGTRTIKVFELANKYVPSQKPTELPDEKLRLSFVSNQTYREVMGEITSLLNCLYRPDLNIQPDAANPDKALIKLTGEISKTQTLTKHKLGFIKKLATGWWGVTLAMNELVAAARSHPAYEPAAKNTGIIEDLTFTLPAQTPIGNVITTINQTVGWIKKVELKSQYQANFTFSLEYRSETENLTSEQLIPVRKKIVANLENKFQAKLVGKI